jgi:ABC-2 type transport system permease protein
MSDTQRVNRDREHAAGSGAPTWWLVFAREFTDLWVGGRALNLVLIYTILLGIWTYVLASNSELSLMPPKEMVFETLKAALACALFICVIIGADSISGERERGTLEALLLTPRSRRQIVVGKFLAAVSPWPVALAITVPYWRVLAQGDEVFGQTVLWGAVLGSLTAPALAGMGMLVSLWSNSNRTGMFVSLALYLFLLLPTQLPGTAQTGFMGALLQQVNPLAATTHFLARVLVNNRPLPESWPWLVSPALLAVLVVGVLFVCAGGLRLEAGGKDRRWASWGRAKARAAATVVVVACVVSLPGAPPAAATPTAANPQPLQISLDLGYKVVKAGDPVLYDTLVTNTGTEASLPLAVAMNIINLNAKGDVVDPEDWSPQRTQYVDPLAPGQSTRLSWRINAILDGNYMVYMVVIPKPREREATSHPVASSGLHLTVMPFTKLNPRGVLPYAIGGPVLAALGVLVVHRLRLRQIDAGGSR